jgi:inner membrane transporter RhtA
LNKALSWLEAIPATLLLLLAVLSINLGSALAILLFLVYGTLGMLLLRMLLGAVMLALAYRRLPAHAVRRSPGGIPLLGITITLQSAAFYEAIARIPLGIAVAIEFLGPLGVALATSRRAIDAGCVVIAAIGIILLTPEIGSELDPAGVSFAIASGIAWAGVILINRRLGRALEGGVGIALGMTVCGLILLPVVDGEAFIALLAHPATIPTVLGVALFSAAIPYLFEYLALKSMPPKQFGVLVALEPVVAAIVGAIALAQMMSPRIGIAVMRISAAPISTSLTGASRTAARPGGDSAG